MTKTVPTLDFQIFANDGSDRQQFSKDLVKSFEEYGFCKIKNHDLGKELIDEAFGWNEKFFSLTHDQKMKAKHTSEGPIRGYSFVGQEDLSALNRADRNLSRLEAWDQMTHDDPTTQNIWPSESDLPGFRTFMEPFFDSCHAQHTKLLQALCIGLGLEQDFFHKLLKTKPHDLRLLHYPAVEQRVLDQAGMTRAADHKMFPDFGSITLLFQDTTGGLEVEDADLFGTFTPITTSLGDMICNIGDSMSRWTNNRLRSTMHRVVIPPRMVRTPSSDTPTAQPGRATAEVPQSDKMEQENENGRLIVPGRRSVVFFGKPDKNGSLAPVRELLRDGEEPLFPVITAGEYNAQRLVRIYD